MTDTDSCSFWNDTCSIKESDARNLIFEIIRRSKIAERLDSSHEMWKNCDFHKPELYKQPGLYKIESTDNPNILTISINPKNIMKNLKIKLITKSIKE